MEAALGRGDVVDEGKEVFRELPRVLDGELHKDTVALPFIVEGLRIELVLALVKVRRKVGDAALVAVRHRIGLRRTEKVELLHLVVPFLRRVFVHRDALVGERDREPLVEEGELAQTVLHGGELELHGGKDGIVGHEMHQSAVRLAAFARLFEGRDGDARFDFLLLFVVIGAEAHLPRVALFVDAHVQPFGERVRHGSAHAVQPARKGIVMLIELAARMQLREYDLHAGDFGLGMDVGGDAPPVVLDGDAPVLIQADFDLVGIAVRRLVDGVVDDLPQNMMEPARAR